MKVCYVDDFADQTLTVPVTSLSGAGATVGMGVTAAITGVLPGAGTTAVFTGYVKGIITGALDDAGGSSKLDVKIVSRVSSAGVETQIDYAEGDSFSSFAADAQLRFQAPGSVSGVQTATAAVDWYDQQTLGLTNSTVYWSTIAPKPGTSVYVSDRQGKNDQLHIAVVDDTGDVTGIKGNVLEKHVDLSKASDTVSNVNAPQRTYFKDYLRDLSANIYAGKDPLAAVDAFHGTTPVATGFTAYTGVKTASFTKDDGATNQSGTIAQDKQFLAIGNKTYTFLGGNDYQSSGGDGYKAELSNLIRMY